MIKKRGKFLTFMFSLVPGAGHMYMGFFKMGISFMSVFAVICFVSAWMNIGPLLLLTPILWFYSFFDAINKMSLSDEEFYVLEDRYLFSLDSITNGQAGTFLRKNKLYVGVFLIFFGAWLLLQLFSNYLGYSGFYYDSVFGRFILALIRSLPELFIAGVIVFIGIRLIVGKKREGGDQ